MTHPTEDPRIRRVFGHIHEHLHEPLPLRRLGDVAGLSVHHLHRRCKAATGVPLVRLVQLLRLRAASMRLAFQPRARITDVALDAGFANPESFSRAFRREIGQSPREFRDRPRWSDWRARFAFLGPLHDQLHERGGPTTMDVRIVDFPETRIARLSYIGPPDEEYAAVRRFIEWRIANRYPPECHQSYGLHYNDPRAVPPDEYHVDLCLSVETPIAPNDAGVVDDIIPAGRYAVARHLGSRDDVTAAAHLYDTWLPTSGETMRNAPMLFHYVNVGPNVAEHEMITDVYLPLE